ncbi:MAG: MotA/TolQ/ExbB proton channel family protein, partial [Pararhodobacter sp.]
MPVSILSELSLAAWSILAALAFVSVIATTIALAKLVQFARRRVGRRQEPDQALRLWLAGDHAAALATAQGHQGSRMQVLRVLLEALARHPEDRARAQAQATLTAMEELAGLSRHLRAIEAVVQAAPMLGLLGTVIGMIEAFARLAQTTGGADPALL